MNYKEQLLKARELGFDPISLEVAFEVSCGFYDHIFDIKITDNEFEMVCNLIEECYLKSENITIYQLVRALYGIVERYIYENDYNGTLEEIVINTSRNTLIEEACWYE